MALGAVDLSSQGEGLGAHFGVPVSPAGDVLSSPQMPVPDNETKAGIFPGKVIIVDHGKLMKHSVCCPTTAPVAS